MTPNVPPDPPSANPRRPQLVRKTVQMARPRAVVPMLEANKLDLYRAWCSGSKTMKDLAKQYGLRKDEVELVLFEMQWHTGGRLAA